MTLLRLTAASAAVVVAGLGAVLTACPASAAPDTGCQAAGIPTLRAAGLLDDVVRDGLPVEAAVAFDVAVRAPHPIPLSLTLADHRAGGQSLLVRPRC